MEKLFILIVFVCILATLSAEADTRQADIVGVLELLFLCLFCVTKMLIVIELQEFCMLLLLALSWVSQSYCCCLVFVVLAFVIINVLVGGVAAKLGEIPYIVAVVQDEGYVASNTSTMQQL